MTTLSDWHPHSEHHLQLRSPDDEFCWVRSKEGEPWCFLAKDFAELKGKMLRVTEEFGVQWGYVSCVPARWL